MKDFFVYLLQCSDGSYYVGHTDDLDKRLNEHQQGLYAGYTSQHLPVKLVYHATFGSRDEAITAEMQIKKWKRSKKEALIHGDWKLVIKEAKRSKCKKK
jgi:predicted GIY-YIG superfamily endonuclease